MHSWASNSSRVECELRRRGDRQKRWNFSEAPFNRNPMNRQYHLAFAQSLRGNGRIDKSKDALRNLLDRSPTFGPANAEFARMISGEGDWAQASWYYHRALYGEWNKSADLRPLRFELADLLVQTWGGRATFGGSADAGGDRR